MRACTERTAVSPWDALLLVPLAVAVAFVLAFARAFPLTDEWFYTRALMRLDGVDWASLAGWAEAWRIYPAKLFDHNVSVPFVLYAPLMKATSYDSRWAIAMTLAAFAGQVWVYRTAMVRSAAAALPIALVAFCPSHYMEFLWGWQVTITLSVLFPIAALALIHEACAAPDGWTRARRLAWGLALLLLGVYSSAGAFFGFAAALLVIGLARIEWKSKLRMLLVCAVAAALVYWRAMPGGTRPHVVFGRRELLDVFTAFGATLWSLPIGVVDFQLDSRSAGGIAIAALTAMVVARATYVRQLSTLALPLGVALMSYLCMASIAVARPYLGNWHVQYALAAVCGGYAAAYTLWRADRTLWAAVPFFGLTALLASSVYGYYEAFTSYGPSYHRYIRSIEDYQFRNLTEPGLKPPYPPQYDNDMGPELFLFLAANGHPLFATQQSARAAGSLPAGSRVFLDATEMSQPITVEGGSGKVSLLAVVVPGAPAAGALLARIGGETVRLWRVHPSYVPEPARINGATPFMAVIVPRRFPSGRQRVELELAD
jgi:hypothetical protein